MNSHHKTILYDVKVEDFTKKYIQFKGVAKFWVRRKWHWMRERESRPLISQISDNPVTLF